MIPTRRVVALRCGRDDARLNKNIIITLFRFSMKKIRAAVVGYGNIGRFTIEALEVAPDFEIAGVVRRDASKREDITAEITVVGSID